MTLALPLEEGWMCQCAGDVEKHLGEEESEPWEEGEKERESNRSRQKPLQGEIMRRSRVVRSRRRTKTGWWWAAGRWRLIWSDVTAQTGRARVPAEEIHPPIKLSSHLQKQKKIKTADG